MIVAPSILAADFLNLKSEIEKLDKVNVDYLHIDIMDGNFVDNISFGPDITKQISTCTKTKLDVHLMIKDVLRYYQRFLLENVEFITFHYEAQSNTKEVINKIKSSGKKVGLSIKPKTSVEQINELLPDIDLVLVMSVEPGFGGQSFDYIAIDKIKQLKELRETKNLNFIIEVDGGINDETSKLVRVAGADMVVAGTYLLKNTDLKNAVEQLKNM